MDFPAIEEYYRKYGPMVFRRCKYMLQEEDRAYDAMQEVFENLLKQPKRFSGQYPSALLMRMATNICLNMLRKKRISEAALPDEKLQQIACSDDFEQKFLLENILDSIFSREKKSTRTIAVMKYIDRLTHEQIAREMNMSISGIRKRLKNLEKAGANFREVTQYA